MRPTRGMRSRARYRLPGVTILDDARDGHGPRHPPPGRPVRPRQRPLARRPTEIPADRSRWGPFVQLADAAEEQVREIIEELAERRRRRARLDDDASKIGDLYASFMDEERDRGARRRADRGRSSTRSTALRDLARPRGVPRRASSGAAAAASSASYVDTDDRNSDRYLVNLVQGGLGLPDESYYREEKFAEIREKYVAYLEQHLRRSPAHDDPAGAAAHACCALETRLAAGPLGARRDPRRPARPTTSRPLDGAARRCARRFDWDACVTQPRRQRRRRSPRSCVRQPSYLAAPLDGARRGRRSRTGGPGCWSACVRAGGAVPLRRRSSRPTSTSTAAPSPAPRSCAPAGSAASRLVEGAIGEAVGKEYVARHFPPRVQGR